MLPYQVDPSDCLFDLFQIVVPVEDKKCTLPDFPSSIQLQVSRVCATNTRISGQASRESLADIITNYTTCSLFSSLDFPNENNSLRAIPDSFNNHAKNLENCYIEKRARDLVNGQGQKYSAEEASKLWQTNTLKWDASFDVWCCQAEQVWLEFLGPSAIKGRPLPFVESIPVCLWISKTQPKDEKESSQSSTVPYSNNSSLSNGEKSSNSEQSSPERERRRTRRLLKDYYSSDSETKSEESEDGNLQGSQSNCDSKEETQESDIQYSASRVADFNLLARIGPSPLRAQMTHSQYVFIMRLLESLTLFQTQMKADVDYFLTSSVSPTVTFSVPLALPELEFAMLCPGIAEDSGIPVTFISPPTSTSGQEDLVDEVIEKYEESTVCVTQVLNEENPNSEYRKFMHGILKYQCFKVWCDGPWNRTSSKAFDIRILPIML